MALVSLDLDKRLKSCEGLNSFMMLLKVIMREEYMLVGVAIISSFLSMCLKF